MCCFNKTRVGESIRTRALSRLVWSVVCGRREAFSMVIMSVSTLLHQFGVLDGILLSFQLLLTSI